MDCSKPSFSVLHCLLAFAQTHVHWVSDAISGINACRNKCMMDAQELGKRITNRLPTKHVSAGTSGPDGGLGNSFLSSTLLPLELSSSLITQQGGSGQAWHPALSTSFRQNWGRELKLTGIIKTCDFLPYILWSFGEGNGNPLQYSCLESPRDRGAGWAAIYRVKQSRTRLKRFSSSSSS